MGLLDLFRRRDEPDVAEKFVGGERVVTIATPDLIEVTAVPEDVVPSIWGVIEKDAALSFLTKDEIRWIQWDVEILARLATLIEPEVYHPKLEAMLKRSIKQWVDEENTRLLGYLRLKRSYLGLERKLQTITAPRFAFRGEGA